MIPLKNEHVEKVYGLLFKNNLATLVMKHNLLVGGGCIRAVVANESTSDIDLFSMTGWSGELATDLNTVFSGRKIIATANAVTYAKKDHTPVQMITRWVFKDAVELLNHFDFTVCGAVVYCSGTTLYGICHDQFYEHIDAKKLVYSNPLLATSEPGGSLLRVMKYVSRGYYCSPESLSRILARLMLKVDVTRAEGDDRVAFVINGLLREVDPLTANAEGVDPLNG